MATSLIEWLAKAWRGEHKLWVVFWPLQFGGWFLIFALLLQMLRLSNHFRPILWLGPLLITAFQIYINVAIWRCAPNSSWPYWGKGASLIALLALAGTLYSWATGSFGF